MNKNIINILQNKTSDIAYIYHDGLNLKGISFIDDIDLSKNYKKEYILKNDAIKLQKEKLSIKNWKLIIDKDNNKKLVSSNISRNSIQQLNFIDDSLYLISDKPDLSELLKLKIRLFTKNKMIQFVLENDSSVIFESAQENISFYICNNQDPSIILDKIIINVKELLTKKIIYYNSENNLTNISIYTKRLFKNYYYEYTNEKEDIYRKLNMKIFSDLSVFKYNSKKIFGYLSASVNYNTNSIIIKRIGKSIEIYQRNIKKLPILLCKKNDPTFLYETFLIEIEQLKKNEQCVLTFSNNLHNKEFDIYTPLLYIEMIRKKDIKNDNV